MEVTQPLPSGRVARKRAIVKRNLLLAGFRLAGDKGIDFFTISDLTEASDCAKGAFYSYFANRDDFISELIYQAVETVGNALDQHGAELPGDEALAIGLRYSLTLAQQQPLWGQFVAATVGFAHRPLTGLGERLALDISRAQAEGLITFKDPSAALLLASGAFLSAVIAARFNMLETQTPTELTKYVLLGLGVDASRAHGLAQLALPKLSFNSTVVHPI